GASVSDGRQSRLCRIPCPVRGKAAPPVNMPASDASPLCRRGRSKEKTPAFYQPLSRAGHRSAGVCRRPNRKPALHDFLPCAPPVAQTERKGCLKMFSDGQCRNYCGVRLAVQLQRPLILILNSWQVQLNKVMIRVLMTAGAALDNLPGGGGAVSSVAKGVGRGLGMLLSENSSGLGFSDAVSGVYALGWAVIIIGQAVNNAFSRFSDNRPPENA
ncbi:MULTISPECIES: hypothetical protein, partial [unclassified Neisseria]|uniref:hypothetical protein n=1 Tax=unclassified Neisseria TaxID=2623750 RepID=UPI001431E44D